MRYRLFAIGLLVPVALSGQTLDLARFGNPPADVRPALIWYWNGQITDSLIDRQLGDMRHAGLTDVVITPVESRLDPAYSSEAWFARIEHALREAQRTGMRVWLSAADSSLAGLHEYSRRFPWAFGNVLKGFWGNEPAATAPPASADTGRQGRILRGAFGRAEAARIADWRRQRTDWAREHGVEFVVANEGQGTAGIVGAADWTLTPEQLRARIGALAARGRLAPLAIHGYWSDTTDVPEPPSLDPSNPWSLALGDLVTWTARVTYLARGRPTATMALLYPTRAAQAWAGTPERQRLDSAFTALVANLDSLQASFDIVPEEMLDGSAAGLRIAPGELRVGTGGQRYHVILAPPVRTMSRETVGWLASLARSGGTVLAWRPLPNEEARGNDAALAATWPDTGPRFHVLDSLPQLTQALIRASWSGVREADRSALRVRPLARGEDRVFLLFNESDRRIAIAPTFRMIGQPELWNPDDGAMRLAPTRWSPRMAVTDVPIELDPFQVVGIVFRARPRSPRGPIGPPTRERSIAEAGSWRFRFASAAADTTWHEQPLGSWTTVDSTYSGTGVYEGTIEVPAAARAAGNVWLDLGRVRDVAEVELNGKPLGRRLWRPYRYEVSNILQNGTNRITVRVTNTLANRKGQPLPSGLLGPVRLIQAR